MARGQEARGLRVLAIAIERDDERPIYRQIEDQIRSAVRDGRLTAGARLPSVRDLSDQLAVARITVANAYDDLVAEGYLTARVGSGTRVARDLPDVPSGAPAPRLRVLLRQREGAAAIVRDDVISLRPMGLGLDLFPTELWGQLLARSWREVGREGAVTREWTHGDPLLREALATLVGLTRGVRADPERIVIYSSVTAICGAVARGLLGPSGVAVLEDPGCPFFTRALSATGARIVGAAVEAGGLAPDALPDRADLLLVSPSWAYPAGGVMSMRHRRAALAWAKRADAVVVEHDWAGTVRFEGGPLPAIESLDIDGRVIFAGGFSETIPPVRIGFAVIPDRLRPQIERGRHHDEALPSPVEQRALAHFIGEGHLETHLRRLRVALSARREHLAALVRSRLAEMAELSIGQAGMQAIIVVRDGERADDLARRATELMVDIAPLSEFSLGRTAIEGLVVDYSSVSDDDLTRAIDTLRTAWLSLRLQPETRAQA